MDFDGRRQRFRYSVLYAFYVFISLTLRISLDPYALASCSPSCEPCISHSESISYSSIRTLLTSLILLLGCLVLLGILLLGVPDASIFTGWAIDRHYCLTSKLPQSLPEWGIWPIYRRFRLNVRHGFQRFYYSQINTIKQDNRPLEE